MNEYGQPISEAAFRFGFSQDGIFEQVTIYKGRNRDMVRDSILDGDWPTMKTACAKWLAGDSLKIGGRRSRLCHSFW